VFPTYENYVEQFKIFVDSIIEGGSITYNAEDFEVVKVVQSSQNTIRKLPYYTPNYTVVNGQTFLETTEGELPVEIFGKHNLNNLAGAKWICQHMGIDEDDFYEAITTFKGASKRLEKIAESKTGVAFKDFAHSPSKVKATTQAVKEQYTNKNLLACLELHTYSSLTPEFLKEYKNTLDAADTAVVFYSPHAVEIKKLQPITEQQIAEAFQREDLIIYTDAAAFKAYLFSQNFENKVLLLMSSGNYGGLNFDEVKTLIA
jgi:UDP-N-acetylmuramate: L-alanyl-gamma-D-glutamyl-meso-diaminopimelate ligase